MSIEDSPLVPVAMDIILHAGDAREKATAALKHAKKYEFQAAADCLEEAKKLITKAHCAQTDVIQGEVRGEEHDINLLFIHAQDTLMTIKSEVKLTAELIEMFEIISKKLDEKQ